MMCPHVHVPTRERWKRGFGGSGVSNRSWFLMCTSNCVSRPQPSEHGYTVGVYIGGHVIMYAVGITHMCFSGCLTVMKLGKLVNSETGSSSHTHESCPGDVRELLCETM